MDVLIDAVSNSLEKLDPLSQRLTYFYYRIPDILWYSFLPQSISDYIWKLFQHWFVGWTQIGTLIQKTVDFNNTLV